MPCQTMLTGRDKLTSFSGIIDGTWIHPQSRVDASARFVNCVIDKDCYVGPNVVIENSVLLPGAVIEEGSVIKWSIIGPEAVIGSFSTLGATCVVGAKEHVAPGSSLSGDVRLGGV